MCRQKEPLGITVTCAICGKYKILRDNAIEDMDGAHEGMCDHVLASHWTEKQDLEGVDVLREDDGWEGMYVGVNEFYSEKEIIQFEKDIFDLIGERRQKK